MEILPFLLMTLVYGLFKISQFRGLFAIHIIFSLYRIYEIQIKPLDQPDFVDHIFPLYTIYDRQIYLLLARASLCAYYSVWMTLYAEKSKIKLIDIKKILQKIRHKVSNDNKSKYDTVTNSVLSELKTLES